VWDEANAVALLASKGATCKGDFVYVTSRTGQGTFVCDDRRSGPFSFVSTGTKGTGTGTLCGQPFTFNFGK
jgi:hypothetical protein